MQSNIIPIVFAANDKYAPYLGVAIHSLVKRAYSNYDYKLYVLTDGLNESHKKRIISLLKDNFSIEFLDVSKDIEQWDIPTVNHLSKETTYRLLIDKLFSEYKKILYLDCDIIILNDISILYNIDIGDCIIGASRAFLVKGTANYIEQQLKFPLEDYFNAGVLIINVEKFSSHHIGEKALNMLAGHSKKYMTQDQDVLNILCHNNVYYIDGRWNVEWEFLTCEGKDLIITKGRNKQDKYFEDPYIVHYTSPIKPWAHPEIQKSEYFWREAKETVFYEEILLCNSRSSSSLKNNDYDPFSRYIFPWRNIKPGSNIIIYGGGMVGKAYCAQVEKTRYCNIVAVCDRKPEDVRGLRLPVISPKELLNWGTDEVDFVLIALEKEDIALQVQQCLTEMGIINNKIIWINPIK